MEIKKQNDIKDCGVVIVQSLHKRYYDKWININTLKRRANYNSKGINIKNLKNLADEYGVDLEAYKGDWDALIKSKTKEWMCTFIEQKGENHYVLFKMNKTKVYIVDPIKGKYKVSLNEFRGMYSGIIITIEKGEYINVKEKVKSPFGLVLKHPTILSWTIITLLVSIILTFTSTIFMKIVLDKILPGHMKSTLVVISLGFGILSLLRALNNFFKKYLIKKFNLNIETRLNQEYFWKLRTAKVLDLNKIESSDHLRRASIIEAVSSFIANSLFIIFYELANFIIASSMLLWISPSLFGISVAAAGISALFTIILQFLIKDKYEPLLKKQLNYLNSSMDTIFSIEEIKEPKVSKYIRKNQEKNFFKYKTGEFFVWKLTNLQSFLSEVIMFLFPIILTWLATNQVMENQMSVGSMMMFLGVFHWFINPIEDLCTMGLRYKQNSKNIELISFVTNLESQPLNKKGIKMKKLERISLNNYTFGYDKDIFSIIWTEFTNNTHICGPNGSGKSSILKVLATKIAGRGDLMINGTELDYYNLNSIRERIFYLDSNPYMPNSSIYEYITLNDKNAIEKFNESIINYNLSKLFAESNLSLDVMVTNNGQNLSAGQKQLIALMRLFAFEYDLVLLDEALENIDEKKVKWLKKSLVQMQKGIFIEVSHSKRYITSAKEVNIEEIAECIN